MDKDKLLKEIYDFAVLLSTCVWPINCYGERILHILEKHSYKGEENNE